jgi:hypothetical protein
MCSLHCVHKMTLRNYYKKSEVLIFSFQFISTGYCSLSYIMWEEYLIYKSECVCVCVSVCMFKINSLTP